VILVVLGLMIFSACKKDDIKSPAELYAEEMDLLERFKETAAFDSLFPEDDKLIDYTDSTDSRYQGFIYYPLKRGYTIINGEMVPGDTVLPGKRVGLKYSMYYILDSVGAEEPYLVRVASNEYAADPVVYTVGHPDPTVGVYTGLDFGIRFMNCYGESRMLLPSPIGGNDYVTRVMEVKITYISR